MPELPEVETVRRTLLRHVSGLIVGRVQVRQPSVVGRRSTDASRNGTRVAAADLLHGARIANCLRLGKQLALEAADGRFLRVQLGMTGQLLVLPARPGRDEPNHLHLIWHLRRSGERRATLRLCFRDVRRFGVVWPACNRVELDETWALLGPDALTIRAAALRGALAKTSRPLKAALLDQDRLAGVGNIYADESLFRAGLHPLTPAASLTMDEGARLARAVRAVLRQAVDVGGSTIRDYLDAEGQAGYFQTRHNVYGRAGLPCRGCGTPLVGIRVIGRATVFCPTCQPAHSGRGVESMKSQFKTPSSS